MCAHVVFDPVQTNFEKNFATSDNKSVTRLHDKTNSRMHACIRPSLTWYRPIFICSLFLCASADPPLFLVPPDVVSKPDRPATTRHRRAAMIGGWRSAREQIFPSVITFLSPPIARQLHIYLTFYVSNTFRAPSNTTACTIESYRRPPRLGHYRSSTPPIPNLVLASTQRSHSPSPAIGQCVLLYSTAPPPPSTQPDLPFPCLYSHQPIYKRQQTHFADANTARCRKKIFISLSPSHPCPPPRPSPCFCVRHCQEVRPSFSRSLHFPHRGTPNQSSLQHLCVRGQRP